MLWARHCVRAPLTRLQGSDSFSSPPSLGKALAKILLLAHFAGENQGGGVSCPMSHTEYIEELNLGYLVSDTDETIRVKCELAIFCRSIITKSQLLPLVQPNTLEGLCAIDM